MPDLLMGTTWRRHKRRIRDRVSERRVRECRRAQWCLVHDVPSEPFPQLPSASPTSDTCVLRREVTTAVGWEQERSSPSGPDVHAVFSPYRSFDWFATCHRGQRPRQDRTAESEACSRSLWCSAPSIPTSSCFFFSSSRSAKKYPDSGATARGLGMGFRSLSSLQRATTCR